MAVMLTSANDCLAHRLLGRISEKFGTAWLHWLDRAMALYVFPREEFFALVLAGF
jgi:hypothetical protein